MTSKFKDKKGKKNNAPNLSLRRKLRIYGLKIYLVTKISCLLLVSIFLFTNVFAGIKRIMYQQMLHLTAEVGFRLKHINIAGQVNTDVESVLQKLNVLHAQPIFALNIAEIYQRLENENWVNSVTVRRKLPDTLYISLVEKRAIAMWQHEGCVDLIDEDGLIITGPRTIDNKLIKVVGKGANDAAGELLEALETVPVLRSSLLAARRFGERRWDLIFATQTGQLTIMMPETNFVAALSYLNQRHKQNKLFDNKLERIDLRDSKKFYFLLRS